MLVIQLKVLESFLCLYEQQNISKAGAKLFISQQGLSRQIQALESELGVSLFSRSKNGVEPTEICRLIYPHIKNMYSEYAAAEQILNYYKKRENNAYSIAFAYGITNSVSSDFMFDYQKQHPEINLKIEEFSQEVCIERLSNGELDGAFLIYPTDAKQLNSTTLIEGHMYVAMHKSHRLALGTAPLDFYQLDGENLITGVSENAVRRLMDSYCEKTGARFKILASSSNNINYVNRMTDNNGIAPMTQTMVARITNPDIVVRRVLTPWAGYLCYCTPINAEKDKRLLSMQRYIENYFATTPVENMLKIK